MDLKRMLYHFRARWLSTAARRVTLVVCLAVILTGAVFTQYYRIEKKVAQFRTGALGHTETFYLPPNKDLLRFASLGHESFLADMIFIRAHAYVLSHLFTDRIFAKLEPFIEAVIHLDPDNPRIYRWASQMMMYGQQITRESVEESIRYAKRGIERFPNDWRFYMDVGFNLYFEHRWYEDEEEERRREDEALEYFAIAASLPGSQLDPNFITELYMRKNDTQMALFQAYRAYHEASDEERKFLRRRIAQLESEAAARGLEEAETAWKASYGFVPFGLYQLIESLGRTELPERWRHLIGFREGSWGAGAQPRGDES